MVKKKVLIITYYWPPSGGPGVQRVLKFVKYLPEFGWEPVVLTVKNGEYPAIDESLVKDVSPNLKVYKTNTREYFSLFRKLSGLKKTDSLKVITSSGGKKGLKQRLFSWVRANFFIPDGRVGWRPFAVRKGIEIIEKENIDLIFTTSPPHSLQLIGLDIKLRTKIPWVADFRDPWSNPYWEHSMNRTSYATNKNKRLEKKVKLNADYLITVSNGVKNKLFKDFKVMPCDIIYNGYDIEDFVGKQKSQSNKIRIRYAGHISSSQVPANFFQAFAALSEDQKSQFDISFFGKYHNSLTQIIDELKLQSHVQLNGYIPHDKVINEIINAELLLLLIPNVNAEGILTGKIFEYLGTGNNILGIGPAVSEAKDFILKHQVGQYFSFDDNLLPFLESLLYRKKHKNESGITQLEQFSRRTQTELLSSIFQKVLEG